MKLYILTFDSLRSHVSFYQRKQFPLSYPEPTNYKRRTKLILHLNGVALSVCAWLWFPKLSLE
ncbi:hypothetical protein BKA82DRAFT_901861 [Pisolithus tinctorius]|uniref:Uncharacterized protein n=1 Tax=Pisolithus tinctorius Marx 270 TaxID=870435 RepID=A0A0C3PPB2_PISTI|nr:hypothetical protein BKA82DRAFT_901861 [Pisolithus tinctorius]KIO10294.1 hypothetical protein M404DRAFT_901861 [Pisolithus tinctorius Marx 270]